MARRVSEVEAYQVMTLSAMGEAETPAGGSDCIRYKTIVRNEINSSM